MKRPPLALTRAKKVDLACVYVCTYDMYECLVYVTFNLVNVLGHFPFQLAGWLAAECFVYCECGRGEGGWLCFREGRGSGQVPGWLARLEQE